MSDLNNLYNAQNMILLCELLKADFKQCLKSQLTIPESVTQPVN